MKIFQGITEIAGQMGIMAGEFKRQGHEVLSYNTFQSYLGYEDHLEYVERKEIGNRTDAIFKENDLFHFHYAQTTKEDFSDLAQLKGSGKKAVMHHWGNDVRFHEQAKEKNPFAYTGDSPSNAYMDWRLKHITTVIEDAIVQDYEVYEYVKDYYKRVHVVPIAVDLKKIQKVETKPKNIPLLVHAPTNPYFKGTVHVERAIKQLKETHLFRYKRIERMNHDEAVELYKEADIILDQVLCGSYGLLSVEAMSLGKPVVTYIRDDLLPKFPEKPPIVIANPGTIYEQIKWLIESPEKWGEIGQKGRKYVETYHDSKVVSEQILSIYDSLPTL
ncbi:glycosyltransferase family protein [Alkalicoccobacillus murimartini]|uniref:Glycosyltransferase involved in cell wall biosynthesis n=1 Tax=Alkalicoccobacillus murimartini TaxID=171685 RepID=A0ABT9YKY5_9BACI|nr:glycosyltransferase [Alkalicoccobacillus murimartini]MDQ0207867.1 glycosyltransferase involved in cell wall biosynthesis [Alkalicoccobacillus murimartini]